MDVGEEPVNDQTVGMDVPVGLEDAGGGRGVCVVGGFKNRAVGVDDPRVADIDQLAEPLAVEIAPKFKV